MPSSENITTTENTTTEEVASREELERDMREYKRAMAYLALYDC